MKIHQLVDSDNVHLDLEAADADDAIESVAATVAPAIGLRRETVSAALVERERLGSTSVGGGFAIPHCKLAGLKRIVVALARFRTGVDFGAGDGAPVSFFFVVLSPPDQPAVHLQVLSQIARVLKHESVRDQLLNAADGDEVVDLLARAVTKEGL